MALTPLLWPRPGSDRTGPDQNEMAPLLVIDAPASFLLRQEDLDQQVVRLVDLAVLVRILGCEAP